MMSSRHEQLAVSHLEVIWGSVSSFLPQLSHKVESVLETPSRRGSKQFELAKHDRWLYTNRHYTASAAGPSSDENLTITPIAQDHLEPHFAAPEAHIILTFLK